MGERTPLNGPINTSHVFKLLVAYRWLNLIPALLASIGQREATWAIAGLTAIVVNIGITCFPARLNEALRRRPWLLAIDLLACGLIIGLTGGWDTPYYLYAFSPLLAGAFFFELGGALITAAGMAGLFVIAGWPGASLAEAWPGLVTQLVGYFLIAGTFGYAASLLNRLQTSHADLSRAHRDLEIIHSLNFSLQSAVDVHEVEERVLAAVTDDLGFPLAMVALIDEKDETIAAWLGKSTGKGSFPLGETPQATRFPLSLDNSPISATLADGQPRLSTNPIVTPSEQVNQHLRDRVFHVFPMLLRGHQVGVLLVNSTGDFEPSRMHSLQAIASQAAVAVGTTMLCIDRAQRLAVQEERIRIAREIHDTVSQSLFGMTYTLDACAKLLPDSPDQVKTELAEVTRLADAARQQLRRSIMDIWPSEMTAQSFSGDLFTYLHEHCQADGLNLSVDVRGDFQRLPARVRRDLYRIAQESLTNTVRYAAANQMSICLDIGQQSVTLAARDDGQGFNVRDALARERDREHFGLRGMQERASTLGGRVEFLSQPGSGTTVLVELPIFWMAARG